MLESIWRALFGLSIKDIPKEVVQQVYEKWDTPTSWSNDLWAVCAMCVYVKGRGLSCAQCPLSEHEWCTGRADESKLYCRNFYGVPVEDEDAWRTRKSEFLAWLKKEGSL